MDKTKLGEYIRKYKDFNKKGKKTFINLLDFKRIRIDQALRILLYNFQIPGEALLINRLIDQFSKKYSNDYKNTLLKITLKIAILLII